MRKLILGIVMAFGLMSVGQSGIAAPIVTEKSRNIEIVVNGDFIKMDVQPVMNHNHLLIPIRSLSSLGLSYSFNSSTKVTTVKNGDGDYLKISVNSKTAYKNEKPIQMEIPAQNKDGRVLVPIRFITESLGYTVQFESIRKFVFVNSKDYKSDPNLINQNDLQAARKAAIALPIVSNFNTLGTLKGYRLHQYSFPVGKADTYFINDGIFTFVQIKDGKAIAIGQLLESDHSQVAGNVKPFMNMDTDPIMEPYQNGNVIFYENGDGTAGAGYKDGRIKTKINVYSDVIQKLPNHQ